MQINTGEKTLSGILPVYKEKGFTSFDVVAKLRVILKIKKIGHTGTLDPDAEGVLPVCVGKATKLVDMLTDNPKSYEARMIFGMATDTQDISGKIIKISDFKSSEEEVINAIASFKGDYDQIPPMYSALKVGGKKLCDLAREGKNVERKPRRVHIYEITVKDMNLKVKTPYADISVRCSKGTYIRTLIHDAGKKLGCFACMKSLLRTEAAGYTLDDCLTLGQIEDIFLKNTAAEIIRPVEEIFLDLPSVKIKSDSEHYLKNGNKLFPENFAESEVTGDMIRVYDSTGEFSAVYKREYDGFKVKHMFC